MPSPHSRMPGGGLHPHNACNRHDCIPRQKSCFDYKGYCSSKHHWLWKVPADLLVLFHHRLDLAAPSAQRGIHIPNILHRTGIVRLRTNHQLGLGVAFWPKPPLPSHLSWPGQQPGGSVAERFNPAFANRNKNVSHGQ
mgnify:CR=1 FL=1